MRGVQPTVDLVSGPRGIVFAVFSMLGAGRLGLSALPLLVGLAPALVVGATTKRVNAACYQTCMAATCGEYSQVMRKECGWAFALGFERCHARCAGLAITLARADHGPPRRRGIRLL